MAEDAPAAAPGTAASKPSKKTPPQAKKKEPSLRSVAIAVLATCNERKGMSMVKLKKNMVAKGVDVEKKNKLINMTVRRLVNKGTVIQTKGTGASGSFKLAKADTKPGKKGPKKTGTTGSTAMRARVKNARVKRTKGQMAGVKRGGAKSGGAKRAGTKSGEAKSTAAKRAGPKRAKAKSTGPKSGGAKSTGPKSGGAKSTRPKSGGAKSTGPKRPKPKPAARKAEAPKRKPDKKAGVKMNSPKKVMCRSRTIRILEPAL